MSDATHVKCRQCTYSCQMASWCAHMKSATAMCRLMGDNTRTGAWDLSSLKREALNTLVDLVVGHPGNASCILGLTALCNSIFVVGLQQCGDFGIQVFLLKDAAMLIQLGPDSHDCSKNRLAHVVLD